MIQDINDDGSRFYPVVAHLAHVLMFQIVTVVQIKTSVFLKFEQDLHLLFGHDKNGSPPSLVYITCAQGLPGAAIIMVS